jgi:hypothetical protein
VERAIANAARGERLAERISSMDFPLFETLGPATHRWGNRTLALTTDAEKPKPSIVLG